MLAWKSNHDYHEWWFEKGNSYVHFSRHFQIEKKNENILLDYTSKEIQKHEENTNLRFKIALCTKNAIILKLSE